MPDDPPAETNDADSTDLQETDCGFVELDLDLFQTEQLKPLVDAARAKRRGVLFMSAAPDIPNPFYRLQICALSPKATDKIRRIIREEIGSR